jgi:uncharacterized membrane protein
MIDEYLFRLRAALAGADRATIQDALADAEEHLTMAFEAARADSRAGDENGTLELIINDYGSPEEVAMAYKELEAKVQPVLAPDPPDVNRTRSAASRFFGVMTDPRAYASLLYMLLTIITGTIYFIWAVTGLSVSVSLIVLIVGFPVLVLFLLSVRSIALVEGRLVEAILGERMPRRPVFIRKDIGFWGRIRALFADRTTWTAILYMFLMLPLGVFYFSLFLTLLAVSLSLIGMPVLQYGFGLPTISMDGLYFYVDWWLMPFVVLGGILLLILTMHLARLLGRTQGSLAKALLVK